MGGGNAPQCSMVVQAKTKSTGLKKYGETNPNKTQQVKDKIINTNLKRRGVKYAPQSSEVQEKMKATQH